MGHIFFDKPGWKKTLVGFQQSERERERERERKGLIENKDNKNREKP